MKKKLCVFTLYAEKGASSQYRAYIFREEIENNFEVKWFSFWDNKYVTTYMHNKKKFIPQIIVQYVLNSIKRIYELLFIAPKSDVIFIQKANVPRCKYTFLKKIKKNNKKIIFDIDDAVYTLKGDHSSAIASQANVVICGNKTLKEYYQKYNSNCQIIPTIENTKKYIPYWSNTFDSKIIGWIGSQTTINNLELIVDSLNRVIEKHPEIKVSIISNTPLDYTKKIKNSYFVKWNKNTYINEISKFTIGIMPLKDNKFNSGKCGFKLIQYLNMKKPVIGSGVGVNTDIIQGNGIIADTRDEWENAFEKLLYDKDFYDFCVKHIERDFFNKYRFENVSQKLVDILNE